MDLEEDLKWFEENAGSQSYDNSGYPGSQAFPASSGGSAHQHAYVNQQQPQRQLQYNQQPAPQLQQQQQPYQQHHYQSAVPNNHSMRSRNPPGLPAMQPHHHNQSSAVLQARPQSQAQSRFPSSAAGQGRPQQAMTSQHSMMTTQPQTPRYPLSQYMQSDDGRFYLLQRGGSLTEIDPAEHGKVFCLLINLHFTQLIISHVICRTTLLLSPADIVASGTCHLSARHFSFTPQYSSA